MRYALFFLEPTSARHRQHGVFLCGIPDGRLYLRFGATWNKTSKRNKIREKPPCMIGSSEIPTAHNPSSRMNLRRTKVKERWEGNQEIHRQVPMIQLFKTYCLIRPDKRKYLPGIIWLNTCKSISTTGYPESFVLPLLALPFISAHRQPSRWMDATQRNHDRFLIFCPRRLRTLQPASR